MKKTILSMAALALLMASCSNNESDELNPSAQANVTPIRIGSTISGVETKAAVTAGSDVTATILMCDGASASWDGFTAVTENTINGTTLQMRANAATALFKAGSAADVSLNPTLYYKDNSTNSWLAAVAPAGEVKGTNVEFASQTGEEDVMYATATNAGNGTATSAVNLTFNHKTTQLAFAVKLQQASGNGEWNGKSVGLKSITIQNAELPASVAFATGNVNWANAANLTVPGINNVTLTTEALKVGRPVMVNTSNEVRINVVFSVGNIDKIFNNVTIKNDSNGNLATETGKAHTITLTLVEPATPDGATTIQTTATVTPWATGAAGNAELK